MKKKKINFLTEPSHRSGLLRNRLERYSKNKKRNRIIVSSIIGVILLIGAIYLYRTYAFYEEKKEFNVLKGQISDFSNLTVKYIVDGVETSTAPSKNEGYSQPKISCSGVKNYSWDNTNWKVNYNISDLISKEVNCTVAFNRTFSDYLINLSNNSASIVKETHEATTQTPALTDYRYIGVNPNNYVCLEESGSCTDDNLYRIIGVIPTQSTEDGAYENRVKLTKYTSYEQSTWHGTTSTTDNSDWTRSKLNTVKLNTTYWNEINNYQKYIGDTKWYLGRVGGYTNTSNNTSTILYNLERGTTGDNKVPISTITKIGLLYSSDYVFATAGGSTNRSTCLSKTTDWNNNDCKDSDWLYDASSFWFITPFSKLNAGTIQPLGNVSHTPSHNSRRYRPVFHLNAKVMYKSGTGSFTDPYRLSI